jgi:CheY-like chemotaxis protein
MRQKTAIFLKSLIREMTELTQDRFAAWVRHAVNHLYNPTELRTSPLFEIFGLEQRESPSVLRRLLVSAIESLQPAADVAVDADAWRIYKLLYHRYVQQFGGVEVASTLSVSTRHMQRLTAMALDALADELWNRYSLGGSRLVSSAQIVSLSGITLPDAGVELGEGEENENRLLLQELAWLERASSHEVADVAEIIEGVIETVTPLAEGFEVTIECMLAEQLPLVVNQRSHLRHALLNLLSATIHSVPQGRIIVVAQPSVQGVRLKIQTVHSSGSLDDRHSQTATQNMTIAQQLLTRLGASLISEPSEDDTGTTLICLALPSVNQVSVLVVDDNPDMLELFRRYLSGSRYSFIGTQEPEQTLALAEELSPEVIVLDVMLPGSDGWELLGRLREHPKTRGKPVIVCTIMPQEQLALSLGAASFLQKPLTRSALLAALDHQADLLASRSQQAP